MFIRTIESPSYVDPSVAYMRFPYLQTDAVVSLIIGMFGPAPAAQWGGLGVEHVNPGSEWSRVRDAGSLKRYRV